jgi:hypothetical protein
VKRLFGLLVLMVALVVINVSVGKCMRPRHAARFAPRLLDGCDPSQPPSPGNCQDPSTCSQCHSNMGARQLSPAVYDLSVEECSHFHAGEESCIEAQFNHNYRYYVLYQGRSGGPPGVPGPSTPSLMVEFIPVVRSQ